MSNKRKYKRFAETIGSVLADERALGRDVYHHALGLLQLQQQLTGMLGPPLDRHVTVANCEAGILTVHAGSSAWAARLRFKVPELLAALPDGPDGITIQTIRIRVRPSGSPATTTSADKGPGLSAESARLLEAVAASISDPDLSQCLLRISRHR